MPRRCSICAHPQVEAINKGLINGEPLRNLAVRFGTSATSLHRHKKQHLPVTLLRAREAREVALADSLLVEIRGLAARTKGILAVAEEAGNLALALKAVRECRSVLELLGKLTGEMTTPQEKPVGPMFIFPPGSQPILTVNRPQELDAESSAKDAHEIEAIEVTEEADS